jgi:hypothetical protein
VIGKELEKALAGRALSRIQIVQTDRVDFVPLEFVYELPTPSEDADLCEGWIERLQSGEARCPDTNHPPADLPGQVKKVCPLGFWALTRIIERQVVKPKDVRSKDGFSIRINPTPAQSRLAAVGSAVFAFSNKLDAGVPGQSEALGKTLNGVTGDRASTVSTWKEWASAVQKERPTLLVLLSHTVDHQHMNALEIGADDGTGSRIKLIELVPEFVKADSSDTPVVLLLGCDTAVERNDFRSFLAQFLDCGAAVVVGTIAPVLGEHAAPVAQALIKELAAAMTPDQGNGRTFGDLMLDVRQRLLMEGELTALCMTSFGDADWGVASAHG